MRASASCLALTLLLATAGCGGREEQEEGAMNGQAVAGQLAQVRVESGLWEAQVEVVGIEGPEIPIEMERALKQRRPARRYCITPEQARQPDALAGQLGRASGACTVSRFSMQDGRMRGQMLCNGGRPNEVAAQMEGTYSPHNFDYQTHMRTDVPMVGGTVMLTIENRGRWIGACPPGQAQEGGNATR